MPNPAPVIPFNLIVRAKLHQRGLSPTKFARTVGIPYRRLGRMIRLDYYQTEWPRQTRAYEYGPFPTVMPVAKSPVPPSNIYQHRASSRSSR